MFYVVYTRDNCVYCKMAIKELHEKKLEYVVVQEEKTTQQKQENYNWRTVPLICKSTEEGEQFIGGYTELHNLLKEENK
jgi:glutaredoxin